MLDTSVIGAIAEESVAALLRAHGRTVIELGARQLPYDLLVDGWRVDVKCAYPRIPRGGKSQTWNFHVRHPLKPDQGMDFYLLRLEGVAVAGIASPAHILVRAPIRTPCPQASWRKIVGQPGLDFTDFSNGKFGNGPICIKQVA